MSMPPGAYSSKGGSRGGGPNDKIPKGYRAGKMQQFTPEQMELFQQLFGHLGPDSFLSKLAGGDQEAFDEMEKPALQQFNALQSGIASKYSGAGMGARRSSGFGLEQNAAAQDFAGQLQSQRTGLRSQALNDLMGMSNTLLGQKPFENFISPKQQKQSGWNSFMQGVGGAIPGAVSSFF